MAQQHRVEDLGAVLINLLNLSGGVPASRVLGVGLVRDSLLPLECKLLRQLLPSGVPDAVRSPGIRLPEVEAIDQEVADLLIKSGCNYIQYAPESGSVRILQVIKKKVNLDNLMASVVATLGSKMQVCVLLIIGFPDETPEDIAETFRFIRKLALKGVHEIAVSCLVPLPGTAIFNDLKKNGDIVLNDDYCYWMSGATALTNVKSWNPAISDNRLRFLKLWGLTQFFLLSWILYPGRALKIVRNLFAGKQENKVDRVLREFVEKVRISKYLKKKHSDSIVSTVIK